MTIYMAPNEVLELANKLSALELSVVDLKARFEERWIEHNKRSESNWNSIKDTNSKIQDSLNNINDFTNNLPCKVRDENTKSIWRNIGAIWATISAVTIAIIGAFLKHMIGGQ